MDGSNVYYGEKDGLLSDTDEVVVLAKDFGDRAMPDQWPLDVPARYNNRFEIQITDPLNPSESTYAYIFLSSSMTQLNTSYFNINQEDDWVKTPTYTVWHAGHGFQAGLYLHKAAGGDSVNIVERQKFRVIGKISGINEEIAILEEQDGPIKLLGGLASIDAYVGPKEIQYLAGSKIRLHRYLELEYRFSGKVLTQSIDQRGSYKFHTTFYPTFAEWQSGELNIPKISDINIREVRLTTDLRSNAWGMQFYNPYNFDPPLRVDKTGNTYDNTIPWPGDSWHMIVANPADPEKRVNNASLLTVTKIPTVPLYSKGKFYYKDSQSKVAHDTGDEKSWGDTGFQMTGNDIQGAIDFYTASYYLPENLTYSQGETLASQHLNPMEVEVTSQILTYTVAVEQYPAAGGNVSITPQLTEHPAYSTVTILAEPNPGYDFIGWTGNIQSTENPLNIEIQENISLSAHYEPRTHEIAFLSNPQGLSVIVDEAVYTTPTSLVLQEMNSYAIGVSEIVEIDDNQRLIFDHWDPVNDRNFQLTVEGAESFQVNYAEQYYLTIQSDDMVTGQVGMSSQDHWITQGDEVTVSAMPSSNYSFSHWSGDTTSNMPEITFTMYQPWSLTAHFTNAPPLISTADTSMAEDDTLTLALTDLDHWVQDDNTPISSLTFSFSGTDYLEIVTDHDNNLYRIVPQSNWFGQDTVWITVTDPLLASTQAPLTVTVNPMADSPSSFSLLSPEHETGISEWPTVIEFSWQASNDPDPTDTLTYIFELDSSDSFQSLMKISIDNIQTMQYILLWPSHLGDNTYYWRILVKDNTGLVTSCESIFTLTLTTDVNSENQAIPSDFVLKQNYPNPFNGSTKIRYGLPRDEQISITVFNEQGQTVNTLWNDHQKAGYHTIDWHGYDDKNQSVSSGLYIIMLRTGNRKWIKKVMLLQ
ncbi:T9SS type A sorting domain-containing protein [bacterium]